MIACLVSQGYGQTITLGVDGDCRGFMRTKEQRFSVADSTYPLPVPSSTGLKIRLSNPQKKAIRINIKTMNGSALELNQESFVSNPITTDEDLVLTVGGKSLSLKKSFNIQIGCTDPGVRTPPFSVNFQVKKTSPQGTANTTHGQPVPLNDDGDDENDTPPAKPVYQPGSAVYDALKLTIPDSLTLEDFKKIIKFYYPESSVQGVETVKDNPFLKGIITPDYISKLFVPEENIAESTGDIFSNLSLSSIGGLDVTKFADGLAKFLVKRTKEELNIAFFTKFKEILDKYPDIRTVFPKTYTILGAIGDEIYNYDQYIQNLREAFKDDIQSLADNLPSIIKNHQDFFDAHRELEAALNSGCYLASSLQKQVHPGDILANYPLEFLDGLKNKNFAGSIQTLQLLSASLRDTSSTDSSYWVNIKYMRQLVDNRKAFQIYLGLVYQMAIARYNKVPFDNTTLVDWLDKAAPDIITKLDMFNQYKLYVMRLAEKTDNLNRMIKAYSRPANDSMAIELYKKYFDAFEDYFEYVTEVGKLPLADKSKFLADLPKQLAPYFSVARSASALVVDINRKNYSSAINNAVAIYNTVVSKPYEDAVKTADAQVEKTKSLSKDDQQRKDARAAALVADTTFAPVKDTRSNLVKYGSFMAAIATAKTSDDVEAAIEAAALPSGSARIKRESPFNISINAYTGLFVGHESIDGLVDKTAFNSFGVTAPVGAAVSWGHQLLFWGTGKHEWSTSLFVSVLDVGAIAAFRFKNDTTSQIPTIELKNILSPGAFLSIGIPKSPLSVNFGAQLGPNLRKINFNSELPSNDSNNKIYWRFSASLCVDIPIFNLYTRSR